MKIIAHRGLLDGPNSKLENHPEQIQKAIDLGFDIEIDIRCINDNQWFLGHDEPQYRVNFDWIKNFSDKLFIHAKNIETINKLYMANLACKFVKNENRLLHYFFHDRDECTITSKGLFWTFPGKLLTSNSIAVLPEILDLSWKGIEKSAGICTDYPFKYESLFKDMGKI